jgi:Concanavalin A-like lectin/glucanases superfamily
MSDPQTIKINGKPARTTWGLEILNIKPYSPLASVRHEYQANLPVKSNVKPQKITLAGHIKQADQNLIQQAIESLASEIGQNGQGVFRKACLEIYPLQADGSTGDPAVYEVISDGTFDIRSAGKGKRAKSGVVYVTIGFEVLAYINPDGIVSRTTPISTAAANIYFEDSDCLQGARNITALWDNVGSGFGLQAKITTLAIGDRFIHYAGDYTGTDSGTHAWCLGAYGNPALGFLLAGNNTLKFQTYYSLPILESHEFTMMIKFKWTGAADGSYKILFADDNTPENLVIYVISTSQNAYFQINGSTIAVHSDVAFSSTDWNTIVVRHKTGEKSIWLHVPGQDVVSTTSGNVSAYTDSPSYFYIGTDKANGYRCDCHISEVIIWKYPLSDAAIAVAAESSIPIRANPRYELNKRITFYLDFLDGFNALCNEHASISCSISVKEGDVFIYQTDGRRATHYSVTGGISNVIANLGAPVTGVPTWPLIEVYNNIRIESLVSTADFTISYNPRRRA